MVLLVSLLENTRGELFLSLAERVHIGGACIDGLGHTSLCLPVSGRAERITLCFTIVFDWSTVHVAATEDARLELLVLFITALQACFLIHA